MFTTTATTPSQAILAGLLKDEYQYMRVAIADKQEAEHMANGTYGAAYIYLAFLVISVFFWAKGAHTVAAAKERETQSSVGSPAAAAVSST